MVFSSLLFLFIYLPVVLAVYYIVPVKWRNIWLFIVNLVFYGWGEPIYILLMILSITVNYAAGIIIAKKRGAGKTAKRIQSRSSKYLPLRSMESSTSRMSGRDSLAANHHMA